MNTCRRDSCTALLAALSALFLTWSPADAQVIPSPGISGASINFNGIEGGGEWSGTYSFAIDYMNGDPLRADVKAFHDATGIYLLVDVDDASNNNNDAVWIRFDLDHSGSPIDANDWGINILRNGQATWGEANVDPGSWGPVPSSVGTNSTGVGWTVEVKLPTGAPSGLSLSTGTVGIYFALYDADLAFSPNSAKYTQWPTPADLNTVADGDPDEWGDYIFDPATTFADLSVTNVRQGTLSEEYRKISPTGANEFFVEISNPNTGAVLPNADDVRINLYLAARGIGEPFHRLDAQNVLNSDCSSPPPATLLSPEPEVCDGTVPFDDISTINLANASERAALVGGTAQYTVFEGVSRFGSASTNPTHDIAGGFSGPIHVIDWTLIAGQRPKFDEIIHGGNTYRRQHQCMKAEAIFPNDPNPANNTRQANMDFVCVPAFMAMMYNFTLGTAGFGKFASGKRMFLQASFANIPPGSNWAFDFKGLERIGRNAYVVAFRDRASMPIQLELRAPTTDVLGTPLKENLIVPPRAGGQRLSEKSGDDPIYVRVRPGDTLLVVNYAFDDQDLQSVDLDGRRRDFPPNGPEGLGFPLSEKLGRRGLLSPVSNPGALVGSFDNFRTSFKIGTGVQVGVPRNSNFLALAINDRNGSFGDNAGTGFRVKVTRRSSAREGGGLGLGLVQDAVAQQRSMVAVKPALDVIPTVCLRGYEPIEQKRDLGGTPHELYRYIGEVCWAVHNVYPRDRSREPDKGDPFDEEQPPKPPGGCGSRASLGFIFSFGLTVLGFGFVRRRTRRDRGELVAR